MGLNKGHLNTECDTVTADLVTEMATKRLTDRQCIKHSCAGSGGALWPHLHGAARPRHARNDTQLET